MYWYYFMLVVIVVDLLLLSLFSFFQSLDTIVIHTRRVLLLNNLSNDLFYLQHKNFCTADS